MVQGNTKAFTSIHVKSKRAIPGYTFVLWYEDLTRFQITENQRWHDETTYSFSPWNLRCLETILNDFSNNPIHDSVAQTFWDPCGFLVHLFPRTLFLNGDIFEDRKL
jgi:hypothetical protein